MVFFHQNTVAFLNCLYSLNYRKVLRHGYVQHFKLELGEFQFNFKNFEYIIFNIQIIIIDFTSLRNVCT